MVTGVRSLSSRQWVVDAGLASALAAVGIAGRYHGQPAERPVAEVGLLHEAQDVGIEAQGPFLVVDMDGGQLDFHRTPRRVTLAATAASSLMTDSGDEM